jgi:hypothetical protein
MVYFLFLLFTLMMCINQNVVVCGTSEKVRANATFWSMCLRRKIWRCKGNVRMGLGVRQNKKLG